MLLRVQAVALRIVKYSDSASIATIWTRQNGRMAVALPAGNGVAARRLRAIAMPLGVFEADAIVKPGREIGRLSDVAPLVQSPASMGDPAKSVVAMFIADFLYSALKEGAPDALMADFIFDSVAELRKASGAALANFHLCFLYKLSRFLGIEPDMGTYAPGRCFDLLEARYTASQPMHAKVLVGEEAEVPRLLSRLNYRNLGCLRLGHDRRNRIVDCLIDYYSMHYAGIGSLSSLSILRSIFKS